MHKRLDRRQDGSWFERFRRTAFSEFDKTRCRISWVRGDAALLLQGALFHLQDFDSRSGNLVQEAKTARPRFVQISMDYKP